MKAIGLTGIAGAFSSSASAETKGSEFRSDRRGPVRKSRFPVEIADIQIPNWVTVELPNQRIAKAEYREGNDPAQDAQLWGRTEYDNLTMTRGVEPSSAGNAQVPGPGSPVGLKLFEWFKKARQGKVTDARKKVTVTVYNESGPQGAPVAKWVFEKAWPIEYSPPTLDAMSKGEIAMESITLAYYKYDRKAP